MLNNIINKVTNYNFSLRFSLLTVFTVLFLTTATIFISIFYLHAYEIVEHAALVLMDEASQYTVEEFNNDFRPFLLVSEFSDELVRDKVLNVNNYQQTAGYLLDILKEYPLAERVHWYDDDGYLIYAWREPNNILATEIISKKTKTPTDEFFYYDKSGRLSKHILAKPNLNIPHSVGYNAAVNKRKSIWTNVFIYNTPPHYMGTSIATPIFNPDKTVNGVLEIDVRLNEFSKKLADHELSEHDKILVIDQQGNVIAAPEFANRDLQSANKVKMINIQQYSEPWVGAAFRLYQANKQRTFIFKYQGTRYFATFKPISIFNNQWFISIVVPASDFSKRIHEVERTYMIIFAVIFIVGMFLISTIVSHVVNPINKLVMDARKIRTFELGSTPYVHSHIKEVIDISDAIYNMRTGLRSFQKYVPAGLVRQLINAGEDARIGGLKRDLAIFFSDIKDFTQITEMSDTDQLMKQIYQYFEALAPVVTENHGTIDKYIGDAMMAFWGAPVVIEEPCKSAARAALQCQRIIKALNLNWQRENKPLFVTRIGIHFGSAIVGNIGSSDRLNYTILGNTVNLTSRLINANKLYGTMILVSESVYQAIQDSYILRFVDRVILKGSQTSMAVYELLAAMNENLSFDLANYQQQFHLAYQAYQGQAWVDAIALFKRCLAIYPQDHLAKVFIERCQRLQANPPTEWNGAWQMTEK